MQNKQILDELLKEARNDFLPENELCSLFEKLDVEERYGDMFCLLTRYPRTISEHFEYTSEVLSYNLEHKWNGDLSTLSNMSAKEWKEDLVSLAKLTSKYRLSKVIYGHLKK